MNHRLYMFRGMSRDGLWHYGCLLRGTIVQQAEDADDALIFERSIHDTTGAVKIHHVRPETIGEYTGSVDCNRRMIYEGDIIETRGGDFPVVWNNDLGGYFLGGEANLSLDMIDVRGDKIVGTVFDTR